MSNTVYDDLENRELDDRFKEAFRNWIDFAANPYHPFVWVRGDPDIGEGVYIGFFSVVNAKESYIKIGDGCDIAPFVSINCADSHRKCLGLDDDVDRAPIILEENVFVGTLAAIMPGVKIGEHSVIAAGEVVRKDVPPCSRVLGGVIQPGFYADELVEKNGIPTECPNCLNAWEYTGPDERGESTKCAECGYHGVTIGNAEEDDEGQ